MTQPVQETNTPRDIAGAQFATNQLARRPPITPPGGAIQDAFEMHSAGSQIIANNTGVSCDFDGYRKSLAPVVNAFDGSESASGKVIILTQPGVYHFWCQVEWADSGFTDMRMASVGQTSGAGFWNNNDSTYQPRVISSDQYLAGQFLSTGPMFVAAGSGRNVKVGVSVKQQSGTSKTLVVCRFSGVYFGIIPGQPTWDSAQIEQWPYIFP